MRPQQSVALLALCGAVVLGGGAALRLSDPGSSTTENAETASVETVATTRRATSLLGPAESVGAPITTAAISAPEAAPAEAELTIKSAGAPAAGVAAIESTLARTAAPSITAAATAAPVTTAAPAPAEPT